jgi:aminoglycoside phosphotransferase
MAHSRPPSTRPFSPNLRRIYDAAAAADDDDNVDDDNDRENQSRTVSIMKESPENNSTNLYHCSA